MQETIQIKTISFHSTRAEVNKSRKQRRTEPKVELVLESLIDRDIPDILPNDELEEFVINPNYPEQKIKVGLEIDQQERRQIIEMLRNNLDVFAWRVEDMKGISEEVIVHKLNDSNAFTPICQKARYFAPDRKAAIQEEVEKLLKASIIEEILYPKWISNIVMVEKENGKLRMCVDFTDLNKACPKDCYPLPRIDQLVDSIAGHKILSFIDAYSGYHQIKMAPEDYVSTCFYAAGKTYCYLMMPFGLKNAGATYSRMISIVFKDQLGRNIEAYIDDMVIKTKESSHDIDLKEIANLRQNNMKLNPSKCAFGVRAGKFLGFMVNQRGIEANPEKIQDLINMSPPRAIKDVQQLNGRITALGRFISRLA